MPYVWVSYTHLNIFSFNFNFPSSSSSSLTIHYSPLFNPSFYTNMVIIEERFVYETETHLTVMKTSLFFAGDGFAVYDSNGQLVFRVDSYGPDTREHGELVLMDQNGLCLLTVRRKVFYASVSKFDCI